MLPISVSTPLTGLGSEQIVLSAQKTLSPMKGQKMGQFWLSGHLQAFSTAFPGKDGEADMDNRLKWVVGINILLKF
ncbi:MAG TPA: hypothetical protein PKH04_01670 [Burkholderiaceae bacterium]|nr:hypothetical protein [Rhodoferax sp.]HNW00752.1 hypothetical protein [Burkholderiaceae bacterium]MBK7548369.1 hypothetical protein [Rhodoferax sp.]MBP6492726.1 hypothetical protein [Rhodoferax sp.]MBP7572648.1 hypothetical protein [Rhodoferax sp.]